MRWNFRNHTMLHFSTDKDPKTNFHNSQKPSCSQSNTLSTNCSSKKGVRCLMILSVPYYSLLKLTGWFHAGSHLLQSHLRRFRILSGCHLIWQQVYQCIRCHQLSTKNFTYQMANLPTIIPFWVRTIPYSRSKRITQV